MPGGAQQQQAQCDRPRAPLPPSDTARHEQEPDTRQRHEHRSHFGHRDRREPLQRVEAARERRGHGRREVQHAGESDHSRGDPAGAPSERGGVARRGPGHGARMLGDDHGRPRRARSAARRELLEPGRLRKGARAVPQASVQLRAGFELQPRAPQLLHEDRWETGSRVDAFDHPPAAAAVGVERATPHVGQLGTTRVRGHEAHTTDSREHDRLAAGIVVPPRLRAPPCDTTECVPQLRDHEHDRDRDDRELERETAAEQPKDAPRRATAAAEPGDLEERPEHGQRQERGHEQPARAPQQTAVCEAGRDERARLIAVDEVVDPVEPARVAGGDRRRDRPGEVQREGPVVGVERIVERPRPDRIDGPARRARGGGRFPCRSRVRTPARLRHPAP